jgi:hypothetical protein
MEGANAWVLPTARAASMTEDVNFMVAVVCGDQEGTNGRRR